MPFFIPYYIIFDVISQYIFQKKTEVNFNQKVYKLTKVSVLKEKRNDQMKHLYYNSIECPETIRLVSSCFGIDVTYHPWEADGKPTCLEDLFALAKSNCFGVAVFLTSHNDAYVKTSKKAIVGTTVAGWINLAHWDSVNGLLGDRYCQRIVTASKVYNEIF